MEQTCHRQRGAIELLPLIVITILAATTFFAVSQVQRGGQDTRSRAAGNVTSCILNTNATDCNAVAGCTYGPETISCNGFSESQCTNGCTVNTRTASCSGAPGGPNCPAGCPTRTVDCYQYSSSPQACNPDGPGVGPCVWVYPRCAGGNEDTCQTITNQTTCNQFAHQGCHWEPGNYCSGTFPQCYDTAQVFSYCSGSRSTGSFICSGTPTATTVTLTADQTSLIPGDFTTLRWSTINAASCTASGGWSGTKTTTGSQQTASLTQNTTFTITCTGNRTISASVTVNMNTTCATVGQSCEFRNCCSGSSCGTDGVCHTNVCTNGQTRCSGNNRDLCSNGQWNFAQTCTYGCSNGACNAPPPTPLATPLATALPTVDLRVNNANSATVSYNTAVSLSWSSTNSTRCVASGSWAGDKGTSGSETTPTLTSTRTYTLTCTGTGGSASDSVIVTVGAAPVVPTVTITANPSTVDYNASAMLTWSSTNATSCTASGGWTGAKAISGSQSTGNLTANRTYTLSCTGPGGTTNNSVTVSARPQQVCTPNTQKRCGINSNGVHYVETCNSTGSGWNLTTTCPASGTCNSSTYTCTNPTPPAPTVTFTVNPSSIAYNTSASLSWSSANATSCTALGSWSGSRPTSGSTSTGALTSSRTYSITCVGSGGSTSRSVTVTVGSQTTLCTANTQKRCVINSNGIHSVETCNSTGTGWNQTLTCPSGSTCNTTTYTCSSVPTAPSVVLSAAPSQITPDGRSTLTWSSNNATSCTASGAWSGPKAINGNQTVWGFDTSSTFTLSCTGPGGTRSASTTVSVSGSAGQSCVSNGNYCVTGTVACEPGDTRGQGGTCGTNQTCCLKNPASVRQPSPTPQSACEERGGRCVELDLLCTPNETYSGCPSDQKCVPEAARCLEERDEFEVGEPTIPAPGACHNNTDCTNPTFPRCVLASPADTYGVCSPPLPPSGTLDDSTPYVVRLDDGSIWFTENYRELTNGKYNDYHIAPSMIILHWDGNTNPNPQSWVTSTTYNGLMTTSSAHFAVGVDGVLQMLPMTESTVLSSWGAQGRDDQAINIEMSGSFFDENPPTEQEIQYTVDLIANLLRQYDLPVDAVFGHYEQDAIMTDDWTTACTEPTAICDPYSGAICCYDRGKSDPGPEFLDMIQAQVEERLEEYEAAAN